MSTSSRLGRAVPSGWNLTTRRRITVDRRWHVAGGVAVRRRRTGNGTVQGVTGAPDPDELLRRLTRGARLPDARRAGAARGPARTRDWPAWVAGGAARGVRAPAASTGRGRTRPRRPTLAYERQPRRRLDRHRVRQVAGLPAAGAHRAVDRSAGDRALPRADQGARRRPVARARRVWLRRTCGRRATTATRPWEEREWVRAHARFVLTNPDMLHRGVLPRHAAWAAFLRRLRFVVIDECHVYRGRLRLARRPGDPPAAADLRAVRRVAGLRPGLGDGRRSRHAPRRRLTGLPVAAVTEDGSPRGGDDVRRCGSRRC